MKYFLLLVVSLVSHAVWAGATPPAPDTIAERVKPCLACHSPGGRVGKDAYYPRLSGKPQGYLYNQLLNFKQARRHSRPMNLLVENLSDEYLAEIAAYFAAQPPRYVAPRDGAGVKPGATPPPLLTQGDPARKIPACIACHGKTLTGVVPHIPGLLGLPADYISAQFGAWKTGTRRASEPDCMGGIARQLDTTEVGAIAAWLAAQPLSSDAHAADALPEELPLRCGSVTATVKVTGKAAGKIMPKARP
ncbi:MAG TPA: cytochrome c4 [Usitatibacteraceae bacterium]